MDRLSLKLAAKSQIKGKIGTLFVISLVIALVSMVPSFIPIVGTLISSFIVSPAFAFSTTLIYLAIVANRSIQVSDAFQGFSFFWTAFKVNFLTGLFTMLWSLLFVIPGIIKSYSYSMSMYIAAENPQIPALDAINLSKKMTEGHKMDLFVLDLSFIGWILLSVITVGLGFIWVGPYMSATYANTYLYLKSCALGQPSGYTNTSYDNSYPGVNI